MEHSKTLMTQRYTEPPARSRQPLPSTTLIRQKARPESSWEGQISLFLVVMHSWLPCSQGPRIQQMVITVFLLVLMRNYSLGCPFTIQHHLSNDTLLSGKQMTKEILMRKIECNLHEHKWTVHLYRLTQHPASCPPSWRLDAISLA